MKKFARMRYGTRVSVATEVKVETKTFMDDGHAEQAQAFLKEFARVNVEPVITHFFEAIQVSE
jgi:hypothetical protein